MFCREHAVQLHRAREDFDKAGAGLVLIGQGTPAQAAHFRDSFHIEGTPLLVDSERRAYAAAGTKIATFSELLGPQVVTKGLRSIARSRVHQGRTIGHPAQLGGILLVKPDDAIPYSHLADDASDNAPVEEVLAAVRAAAG